MRKGRIRDPRDVEGSVVASIALGVLPNGGAVGFQSGGDGVAPVSSTPGFAAQ